MSEQKSEQYDEQIGFNLWTSVSFPLPGVSQNLTDMTSDSAGESSVFVPIAKYLQRGDAECLAAWFADNLQVNVMGTISNCSRSQARQIIRNFSPTIPRVTSR